MFLHSFILCRLSDIFFQCFHIDGSQLRQALLPAEDIPDVHLFLLSKGYGNDLPSLQIGGKDPAGDGISI